MLREASNLPNLQLIFFFSYHNEPQMRACKITLSAEDAPIGSFFLNSNSNNGILHTKIHSLLNLCIHMCSQQINHMLISCLSGGFAGERAGLSKTERLQSAAAGGCALQMWRITYRRQTHCHSCPLCFR